LTPERNSGAVRFDVTGDFEDDWHRLIALAFHGRDQGGDINGRKIAEAVGYRIGKDDLVAMAHRAAGIDDVRHVSFALGRIGAQQRFAQAAEHFRWILFVEQRRPDRIFSHRTDAVCQQQPAFIEFDRRSAIADLHELPGIARLQDWLATVPGVEIVGIDQIEIFVVLSRDHRIFAIDLLRE
jgi:hypothetical protein